MSWAKIALNADLRGERRARYARGRSAFSSAISPRPCARAGARTSLAHRLRREIVATTITNTVINAGGPAAMVRLGAETGEPVPVVVEAFLSVQRIFGVPALWAELDRLDGKVAGLVQLELYAALQDLFIGETARVLQHRGQRSFAEITASYQPAAAEVTASLPAILPPAERTRLETEGKRLATAGVPADLAMRLAGIGLLRRALPLVEQAAENGAGVAETARIVFAAADFLSLDELRARAAALTPADDFDRQAIERALSVLDDANATICRRMLADPTGRGMALGAWVETHAPQALNARPLVAKVLAEEGLSIARLGAIADSLRELK